MKPLLATALIVLTLSFCNLLGKRSNENSNANQRESGSTQETSNAAPPLQSGPPSQSRNSNTAVPEVGSSAPAPNTKSAAAVPRAPISGGVLNGKATYLPKPAYPAIAKAAHASGQVTVQVTVDESGNVTSASAVSGHPLLKASAEAAARQAKFSPTLLSGQRVKITGVIVYNFVAQ
jgi:periplasmic protein TonB